MAHSLLNLMWRARSKAMSAFRGAIYRQLIKLSGGSCGPGLSIHKSVTFKYAPHSGIKFGQNVHIGERSYIDAPPGSKLILNDHAYVGIGVVIATNDQISIGSYTLIGEYTSIRDSNHSTTSNQPIQKQPNASEPLIIGNDVWIGRGAAILKGSHIGDHSIIAANSVVKAMIPKSVIAAGVPARVKKSR